MKYRVQWFQYLHYYVITARNIPDTAIKGDLELKLSPICQ